MQPFRVEYSSVIVSRAYHFALCFPLTLPPTPSLPGVLSLTVPTLARRFSPLPSSCNVIPIFLLNCKRCASASGVSYPNCVLGGRGASLIVVWKPSASKDSDVSACRAGERLLEFDRFDIPLGALPSGRFLRFSGERPAAEVGLDVTARFMSSARSALSCKFGGCCGGSSFSVEVLFGDLGGDAGLECDVVRGSRSSKSVETSSLLVLELLPVFRGDRFGETSCSGCESFLDAGTDTGCGRRSLSIERASSSFPSSAGRAFGAGAELFFDA